MGFGGILKKFGSAGADAGGFNPYQAGAKAVLGGVGAGFATAAANKNAKIEAKNQNAANKYDWRTKVSQYGQENLPGLTRTRKTSTLRDRIVAALTGKAGSASGLQKLMGNMYSPTQAYTAPQNYMEMAGAPPEVTPQHNSVIGGVLKGMVGG